jgi:hypothetical protein
MHAGLTLHFFRQALARDFQASLGLFGINALLFRITRLCKDYPRSFRDQLLDFRLNWQRLELTRVQANSLGLDRLGAYSVYAMCTLMRAPADVMPGKDALDALLAVTDYCSHWRSVLALDHVGAFRDPRRV